MRKLTVFVPCFLVGTQPTLGSDERSKGIDCLCMCCECRGEEGTCVWPIVVGAMTPRLFEEGERRVKGCTQFRSSSEESSSALSPQLETVIGEHDKKCASKSYQCSEYRCFYDWFLTGCSISMMFIGLWISWPKNRSPNV
jgi:hypothetical protein